MRYVISAAAFLIPMLLAMAIGSVAIDSEGPKPRLDPAVLGELREFAQTREALLDRYASSPGQSGDDIPHLALERFDRRGCDPGGRPWFRLSTARTPVPCGLLRRASSPPVEGQPQVLIDGRAPALILPLTRHWSYWEHAPPAPPTDVPRKSP